jgi:carboxylesterase type B
MVLLTALLTTFFATILAFSVPCNGEQDIRLDVGCIRGSTVDGVDKFLGVPFAKPPTGNRRFKPPAALPYNNSVIDATIPGKCCWGAVSLICYDDGDREAYSLSG